MVLRGSAPQVATPRSGPAHPERPGSGVSLASIRRSAVRWNCRDSSYNYIAIGITISNSPTRQGFHDRLAGGTYVVHQRRHTATAQE